MKLLIIFYIPLLLFFVFGCGNDSETNPMASQNHPPVLETQNDTTATVSERLVLQAVATDLDGDELTYGFRVELSMTDINLGHIPDVQMDDKTGYLVFIPADHDSPDRSFEFTVNDGRGGKATETFKVIVTSQAILHGELGLTGV